MKQQVDLNDSRIQDFVVLIEEATRSTDEGVKFFVEPAHGALKRTLSKRHHFVFGRRGSGKSSLLRKASHDLSLQRTPHAWVDLEPFKGHSYPDLLLSILIQCFSSFGKWLDDEAVTPTNKVSVWKRILGRGEKPDRAPLDRVLCIKIRKQIDTALVGLRRELQSADDASLELRVKSTEGAEETKGGSIGSVVKVGHSGVGASTSAEFRETHKSASYDSLESVEAHRRSKIDYLRRNIIDFQEIFDEMAKLSPTSCSYLFLDDLYHIRRAEQASVVDYFHSVAKGHGLWLKIGTIRHRSTWYLHGDPPSGMKLGDDADEIDLDLTLEQFEVTKSFLSRVLDNLLQEKELQQAEIMTAGAVERLVLGSGGVARDFLGILRRAIAAGQGDTVTGKATKVTAEHVNKATGDYDSTKKDEFRKDIYTDEEGGLNFVFNEIRDFCLDEAVCNCFLVDKSLGDDRVTEINELVDLKLLHRIRSRVTVNTRSQRGRTFDGYMLDLSQYSGTRKKRGLDLIEFWKPDSENQLRRAKLIFEPPVKGKVDSPQRA